MTNQLEWCDAELAWAAGFFDGEGSIGIYARGDTKGHRLDVTIGNVDLRTLEIFKRRWGGSMWTDHRKPPRQTFYFWSLSTRSAQPFLLEILPYLIAKREQAEVALAFQARRAGKGHQRVTGPVSRELDKQDAAKLRLLKKAS